MQSVGCDRVLRINGVGTALQCVAVDYDTWNWVFPFGTRDWESIGKLDRLVLDGVAPAHFLSDTAISDNAMERITWQASQSLRPCASGAVYGRCGMKRAE